MFAQIVKGRRIDVVRSLMTQNHYQRLGFKTNMATQREIRDARDSWLRKLCNGTFELTEEERDEACRLIRESYDVLRHPQMRKQYDRSLVGTITTKRNFVDSENIILERYRLGSKISDSGRANVFLADDLHLGRKVVVKKIRNELRQDSSHRAAFRREADFYAKCNSPHLVKILDYDFDKGAIVQEKMASDIQALPWERGLPEQKLLEILSQSLKGLETIHEQEFAHGRIDMRHLLLDDRGQVKLSVTPGFSNDWTLLQPDQFTKHIAPEMLNPSVFGEPTPAVDIYALGFVILELACGKKFTKAASLALENASGETQDWLLWHASPKEHLPPIREMLPNCSEELTNLLERMTSKYRQERFKDAREASEAISGLLKKRTSTEIIPQKEKPEVVSQIQMLGMPPQIQDVLVVEQPVTWQDILSSPRTLLQTKARSHAITVGLAALFLVSAVILLMPNSAATTTQQVDESAVELTPPEENWEVNFGDESKTAHPTEGQGVPFADGEDGEDVVQAQLLTDNLDGLTE